MTTDTARTPNRVAPLPRPAGAGPGVVARAWPTGRLIFPYTEAELAAGVDCYTRALKRVSTHCVPKEHSDA